MLNLVWFPFISLSSPALNDLQVVVQNAHQFSRTQLEAAIHHYDRARDLTAVELENLNYCRRLQQDGRTNPLDLSIECDVQRKGILQRKHSLSDDWDFLNISGWTLRGLTLTHPRKDNALGNPDAQTHLRNSFVTWLTDPQFKCEQPTLARYFATRLQTDSPTPACSQPGVLTAPGGLRIPFERVSEVHVLFAGEGSAIFSRWGHSMFRLVICAKHRTGVGPECRKDEIEHLVLSFRAFPGLQRLQMWPALRGKYPSRAFLLPLTQVKLEYNLLELREIHSSPIALSREEIHHVLERINEVQGRQISSYEFFRNNCATEAMNFLRTALFERFEFGEINRTPIGMWEKMQELKWFSEETLLSKKEKIARGLYYPSREEDLQKDIDKLKKRVFDGRVKKFGDYLNFSTEEKEAYVKRAKTPAELWALYNLQTAAVERYKLYWDERMTNLLFSNPAVLGIDPARLQEIEKQSLDWQFKGIASPQLELEMKAVKEKFLELNPEAEKFRQSEIALKKSLADKLPGPRLNLEQLKATAPSPK